MKSFYFSMLFMLSCFFMTSCTPTSDQVNITISNNLDFDRTEELVEIPVLQLQNYMKWRNEVGLVITDDQGVVYPSQITYNGLLIFQPNLKANSSRQFIIKTGEKRSFASQVEGKFRPERKGDFSWENNRVGFRFYGKELIQNDGPSNGLDIFLKRTDSLVLDKWYYEDINKISSYHKDTGEGCDPYNVGRSLGAGANGLFVNDSLFLNENYDSYEILDEGPLRVTFLLKYPFIEVGEENISDVKRISLDVNSQLTRIEQTYQPDKDQQMAVGFVKRLDTKDSTVVDYENNFLLYEEPEDEENGIIYLGAIIPAGIDSVLVNTYDYTNPIREKTNTFSNTIALTKIHPTYATIYYTGFGWSKYGFRSLDSFRKYLKEYSVSLKNPFEITFHK